MTQNCIISLYLISVIGLCLGGINSANSPGPGINYSNKNVLTTTTSSTSFTNISNNISFPRRRASSDASAKRLTSQMQSRAVDTRVQLQVPEGEPKGSVVGYIPTKPGFTYRFNEPPQEFTLDANTGEIKTNAILDRENLQDRYDFVVLSSQPTYPIEVRITVLDINDNAPEFPEPTIAVTFSESTIPGTRILLDAATDIDAGINSVTDDYRIVDGNADEKFRLAVTQNPSGDVSYLHLETTGKLDRETLGFYSLNISACDGGSPPRNGYLQVNITVLDVNDNPPIFDHSDYIVSLNETIPPGTTVLQVMASDNDLGDNSKITYYLSDSESQFTVDPEMGIISTTKHLSCPLQNCPIFTKPKKSCPKSCVFTVFARDHGSPRQDGRTYVTVNLVDTNDNDPIIRFQYFPLTSSFATVDENAGNSSVVAAVSVVDIDDGQNGDSNIEIVAGNDLLHFRLEKTPSFDIVRVNGVLDREEIEKYNLTVVATDKGYPPRTATAFLIIHVNDVNDHEPVFEKSEYSSVLSELSPPGSYVSSITATDEDSGVNAEITYDIVTGNNYQWLSMDKMTGLITTIAYLDRELQDKIELTVSARDGGPNPKWAYTQLKVTILDENDEAPTFSNVHINVSLSENVPPETFVAMLTAIDNDQGTNGSVTYSLPDSVQQKYFNIFALDTITGQLVTKTILDREEVDSYEIKVIAKDQGQPAQSATAIVYLTIEDINDNNPVFYPKQYFVAVSEDARIGQSILIVTATDRDYLDNAIITYNLESGGDDIFFIDSRTGTISLRNSLSSINKSLFKLIISARDSNGRVSEENAIVEIFKKKNLYELSFVTPNNDGIYKFEITEDYGHIHNWKKELNSRTIGRVQVDNSSLDFENNVGRTLVSYLIVSGDSNGIFVIDEISGIITTASTIDREKISVYTLTVIARNGLLFGKVLVSVFILDINDNPPEFYHDIDEIHLPENTAVAQEVYLFHATDHDSGINSQVSYGLSYNPDEEFGISESTGLLSLNKPIRSEPGTILNIEIMATDSGNPSLLSKYSLKIIIDDVNDHTPVFDHTSYETSLLESTALNFRFFALGASDIDIGANGRISYQIVDGNHDEKFGIFPDGFLFVKNTLDREERDYFSLTIACSDYGEPSRSSIVPVIIHIIDENDNPPKFPNNTFLFTIMENEPSDSFVGRVVATDRDIGRNAELIYSISNRQNDFTIDLKNGFIRTTHPFDREAVVRESGQNFIEFEVIVSDKGVKTLKDKVKVKVFIKDLNDNAPQFLRAPYRAQLSEGSLIGTNLIRVYTTDADDGLNGEIFYGIISGNTDDKFSMDKTTGQVTLLKTLDREIVSTYSLAIIAYDAAIDGQLSSVTTITVDVLDENDNTPEFTQTSTEISVNETAVVGMELMRFRASDNDYGINCQIIFSISAGNRRDTFHIEPKSGSLYLHKPLDYEETTSYVLNITASDGGNPQMSATIMFNINVLDENDNAPNFPNTAIVRQIKEGIEVNTPIVTVTAEDPDSLDNGKVIYDISHQDPYNNNRSFAINPTTGVIRTILYIDRESVDAFRLTVIAIDQAKIPIKRLSAVKIVTVIVEDINDNAPIFVSMNAAVFSINDLQNIPSQNNMTLLKVYARDADSGTNGLVSYEMINGNIDQFKLHRTTGIISFLKPLFISEARYKLTVKATDEAVQNERKSSDAYIAIIVLDTNNKCDDEYLKFENNELYGSVYENEEPGTSILTVIAYTSGLWVSKNIEYYVTNVTGNGKQVDRLFDIDTQLGILSTSVELDREIGVEIYEIEVYAVIAGETLKACSTQIKINVLDRNDNAPTVQDTPLKFSISEDMVVGHSVAKIVATDVDTIGVVTYNISFGSDNKFVLDSALGILKLADSVDRETKDIYEISVLVSDGLQFVETLVLIEVTDTNDNPPVFTETVYSFDIPENAPRGYQVGIICATDNDLGDNAIITYTVISDWANDVFSLNPETGIFTLTSRLDYEEVQHYILVIQAQDNGHPSLSTTVTVYCNVLDLNDNSPVFDPMSYSNEIYENVPIGTEVVTISATDIDSGENGRIEFNITSGNENQDFEVAKNNSILTKRQLDREKISAYSLVITAEDCAQEPDKRLSATVQVMIIIKDINDESPEFTSEAETSVMENTPLNSVVTVVKAIDRDEGRNAYIEYSLFNESVVPFTLGSIDGLLRVFGRLDRELMSSYSLLISARDRGEPQRVTQKQLNINILDENDNSPVFDPKQYSASVAENASIGTMVLEVSATDIDDGYNGRVRYIIAAGDENRDFSITEDTGIIRVAKNLNFERKFAYILSIRAEDCGSDISNGETRYDMAEVNVAITDINDNPPTFLNSPYLAFVMENVIPPNGGIILTVNAFDADSPPYNSQVRYFLKDGDSDLFQINSTTGDISLLHMLDRELKEEYILTIVGMDAGSPPLIGSGIVRVVVEDMNDHNPEFERASYKAIISENEPTGTIVIQPKAIDKDTGLNSMLRFSLLGDQNEMFHINGNNGLITTSKILDREKNNIYYLSIMAQDSSKTEPRFTSVNLTVVVSDLNDNTPLFKFNSYHVNIPDKSREGQFVFGALATDLDDGNNGKIIYSIKGRDHGFFQIHPESGIIKTTSELSLSDHSMNKVFSLIIYATDRGIEPRETSTELSVTLRPFQKFPVFDFQPKIMFHLSESIPENEIVTKVSATSPKNGSIGYIRYSIAGGNILNSLKIDSDSGELSISHIGLDYEKAPRYDIWIQAADSDDPSLGSVIEILINVTDANDNAPMLEKSIYHTTILEEEPPPVLITKVSAIDFDSNENGAVQFRLLTDFHKSFEVDADSGEIYTTVKLDREVLSRYELIIEAFDHGVPQKTGSASILVDVLDKNDNPPRFTRLFSVNVTENAEIGSFVIKVTSCDMDNDENSNNTYIFTENPGNKFNINQITGNVTVSGHLDREIQEEYVLKIAAIDGAWRAETPLTITIQDQNDNSPEFEHSYYSFSFSELQHSLAFVGQIIATDRDKQGPNSVISYSLQQASDFFTIDPATGEIFSKRVIHYKHTQIELSPENIYTFIVIATDNGKPPMYSECLVNVNIVDANNNAPKFQQQEYLFAVPEDIKIGQKISQIVAIDELDVGINAELDYLVIGGNSTSNFVINRFDGWITVTNTLSFKSGNIYIMVVRAIDRGIPPQQDEVTVRIIITSENTYSPVFSSPRYQIIVPENEPIGSVIVTINAIDNDDGPNGIVRYILTSGNDEKYFDVDRISGSITIKKSLDYDDVQSYYLNITAYDLGFKPRRSVAEVQIILTDINDNAPTFNQTIYYAYIAENRPSNSFVFRVIAYDRDSPKNAIVEYFIIEGSGKGLFQINQINGTITSEIAFDYEEENIYNLIVVATNPNSSMSNYTEIIVYITSVNEYVPQFLQPVFHFDVSESAEIGTSVGVIQAFDKDTGSDGKVYYLLVGSSNDKGFNINFETGVIIVSRNLDRETQSRVVLAVMAKNAGGIRGNDTDEAQVIISIQDGNDPPEFINDSYKAVVSEGATVGTIVLTVIAIDADVRPQNNQFGYTIITGNINNSFKIDPQLGSIETSTQLNREAIASYNLVVGAIDTGVPAQTGTATVKITVTDINDNAPHFESTDRIGYVMENEPPGTSVMTLIATDQDLAPNGPPFTYNLIGGRHMSYVTIDKYSGLMTTTIAINRELTPVLELLVEVEDNGIPKLRSQNEIKIIILDQNDSPSTPRTVKIFVYFFNYRIPSGMIADVHPNDEDATGEYQCKIVKSTLHQPFNDQLTGNLYIPNGCNLHIISTSPWAINSEYSLSILGNDGKHADVVSHVNIEFVYFNNDTVENSIAIRIQNITAVKFVTHYYFGFLDLVKSVLDSGDELLLYSLRNVMNDSSLELTVTVKNTISLDYQSKSYTIERLSKIQDSISQLLKVSGIVIGYTSCNENICENGGNCIEKLYVNNDLQITDSPSLIFSSPSIVNLFQCICIDGYTGLKCDKRQDPCSPNPCQHGAQCRRQGTDFHCLCSISREGKFCELERSELCNSSPCKNGGSCRENLIASSFFCLCRPGYRGPQCETLTDSCRPNPCSHGGLCVSLKPGYKCSCTDGRYGRHCERTAFGFQELSFMSFPALDSATNDISIIFATTKQNALLIYNYGIQTGGRSDFVAIELKYGKAVFSCGGSRTAIKTIEIGSNNCTLSNGKWNKVTATRNGRVMSLSISRCSDNGDNCEECRPGDRSCYSDDIGAIGILNFNKNRLLIGGLDSADPVLERPGQIHSDDFVGCIHSVSINGRSLNLSNPIKSYNVIPTCNRNYNGGACAKGLSRDSSLFLCGSSGKCVDRWETAMCQCGSDLFSPDCYNSLDPISLGNGGFIEFKISEKHRRMQLLDEIYSGLKLWPPLSNLTTEFLSNEYILSYSNFSIPDYSKTISVLFKTKRPTGLILYTATNKHYTYIELRNGKLSYQSKRESPVNMTIHNVDNLANGEWHNVTLSSNNRVLQILVDGAHVGDELDAVGVHDFLDPYLTVLSVGGVRPEFFGQDNLIPSGLEGCVANFTINNEIQPFNGSGSVFKEVLTRGKVYQGCYGTLTTSATQVTNPLSIGITLVIVFFIILLVAIFISFIVFRLRKQQKDKRGRSGGLKQPGGGVSGIVSTEMHISRGLQGNDPCLSFHNDTSDIVRGISHSFVGPELLSRKYKDREINSSDLLTQQRPQRPDIIDREEICKSPPLREEHHPPIQPPNQHHSHDHINNPGVIDINEFPEHYDLENASSIAPSDIDIVYHYKGYREAGGVRRYKATPAPLVSYSHHKHSATPSQHRHSPHRAVPFSARLPLTQANHTSSNTPRQHQSTPLARLSPSSELSSQQPRILTLHDISGKPLQSALLATTSSSGGIGKDALHSNSERSLNSPVMSQLSGQSSTASHIKPSVITQTANTNGNNSSGSMGLTADEIQRLNTRPRTSSLVSTLDAVSSSSEVPRGPNTSRHLNHLHNAQPTADTQSSTSDESANDSFTCSEIEYDNNSMNGEKSSKSHDTGDRLSNERSGNGANKVSSITPPYNCLDASFRGSLSTLVASDDDLSAHIGNIYRQPNRPASPSGTTMGWDYLLNWGPNFESFMGVFKDMNELPENLNGAMVPSLRISGNLQKSSEEYV